MDFKFNDHRIYNEDLNYTTFRVSETVNHKFNSKHTVRAGVIFSDEFYDLFSAGYDFDSKQNKSVFDNKGNTYVFQSFLEWKYRMNDKLTLNTGVHYLNYFLNKSNSIEPRAGIIYQLNNKQSISAGVGLHSKIEPVSVYLINISADSIPSQPNKNLGLSKSFHSVLGYDISISEDVHFKAEAYYQYLYNIPVGVDSVDDQFSVLNIRNGFVTIPLTNSGKGRNYGLDITFEKYFTKSYYFMITGSLYDSRFTPADGKEYNTTFNGNYIFNALAGKEWNFGKKKNTTMGLNFRFLYRGGMRYRGVDLSASGIAGEAVYFKSENYTNITKDVYNIDLGINIKRNLKKYSWTVSLDLNNLTSQNNIIGMKYNVYTGTVKNTYDLLLLPILTAKINF
jgi:hypothetical protein